MHLPNQRFWPLLGWGLVSIAFPELLARSLRFRKPTTSDSEADLERVARTWRNYRPHRAGCLRRAGLR